jgi:dTDP-4-dehydrorhamnose 3,5-epimerase-like enzyme
MEKDTLKIKKAKKVDTKDSHGKPNGFLLELVSDRDNFTKHIKGQMYLSVAALGDTKGYHMHARSDYYVICVKGKVQEIVYKDNDSKEIIEMGDGDFKLMELPRGCPHAVVNIGSEPAYMLMYRYPAWDPDVNEQLDIAPEDIEKEESWEKIREFKKKFD